MTGAFDKLSPAVTRRFERRIDVVAWSPAAVVLVAHALTAGRYDAFRNEYADDARYLVLRVCSKRSIIATSRAATGITGGGIARAGPAVAAESFGALYLAMPKLERAQKTGPAHLRATCKTQLADTLYTNIIAPPPEHS